MKTLTVAELRYLLAQLPPEMDDARVICVEKGTLVEGKLDSNAYTVTGVTRGTDLTILNLD
jgi:hypothetical protein